MSARVFVSIAVAFCLHLLLFLVGGPPQREKTPLRAKVFRRRELEASPFRPAAPEAMAGGLQRYVKGVGRRPTVKDLTRAPLDTLLPQRAPLVLRAEEEARWKAPDSSGSVPAGSELSLNDLALEAHAERARIRERYTWLYLPDADTTDAPEQTRAREIAQRFLRVTGGAKAWSEIESATVVDWVLASEHVEVTAHGAKKFARAPYLHWAAARSYAKFVRKCAAGAASRAKGGTGRPADNPAITLGRYRQLFSYRWSFLSSARSSVRRRAEEVQWHPVEHFLAAGVSLAYKGRERAPWKGVGLVEVVKVTDRKYGLVSLAYFAVESGLLVGMVEVLNDAERKWYRESYGRASPEWWTRYEEYVFQEGVATPRRITRSGAGDSVTVYRDISYNCEPMEGIARYVFEGRTSRFSPWTAVMSPQ